MELFPQLSRRYAVISIRKSSSELELPHHEEDLHGIRSFHEHLASGDLTTADRGKFGWVGSYDLIIQLPNLFGSYLRQTYWGNHLRNHHIYRHEN